MTDNLVTSHHIKSSHYYGQDVQIIRLRSLRKRLQSILLDNFRNYTIVKKCFV